jgi:tellurite resistance protein TerC
MGILSAAWLGMPVWLWLVFIAVVVGLMIFDFTVLNRTAHVIGARESLLLSGFYVTLALTWSIVIWFLYRDIAPGLVEDRQLKAVEGTARAWTAVQLYVTGYLLEYALSLDNVFVISVILTYLNVPRAYHRRVLLWGILGMIVLRGIFIGAGTALVIHFHWVLYFFGAFLIWTGFKLFVLAGGEDEASAADNKVVQFVRRRFRVTEEFHGGKLFVRQAETPGGRLRLFMTPLMLAIITVEVVDLVFAVDSVPAVLAVTPEPFIVYTSNVFAVLGLQALYFALSAMIHRFEYLKYAIALVLVFIGIKILLPLAGELIWKDQDAIKLAPIWSLIVTVALLLGGVVYSLFRTAREPARETTSSGGSG